MIAKNKVIKNGMIQLINIIKRVRIKKLKPRGSDGGIIPPPNRFSITFIAQVMIPLERNVKLGVKINTIPIAMSV
jgi:hypothetical protein